MSNNKDSIGDRMKQYESVPRIFLTRRIPVIIRVDARAAHTFTKSLNKPFDKVFMRVMQYTMQYLCENIQGCVFGYTQSDEITLVLTDYATITTDAWFGYNVEKMVSISASMATLAFNKFWDEEVDWAFEVGSDTVDAPILEAKRFKAMFDSRVFNIPKEEVCNCLIWRQQDAIRNSIEAVGQANFNAKQLHKKTCNMIQDMLFTEKGINWNDYPTSCKRGTGCYKHKVEKTAVNKASGEEFTVLRNEWFIDNDIPIFSEDREYIEKWL